ncbi:hypothetical protein F5B22DRAFT_582515, partial [Xylaria bambusicola]|uniref:uncharacterized protein n=1 Tax=Xylaria bambusicola TaxID=326684 RepID=UPI002008C11B
MKFMIYFYLLPWLITYLYAFFILNFLHPSIHTPIHTRPNKTDRINLSLMPLLPYFLNPRPRQIKTEEIKRPSESTGGSKYLTIYQL